MTREIIIRNNDIIGGLGIYFIERINGETLVGKQVDIVMEKVDEYSGPIPPTIPIPYGYEEQFISAIKSFCDKKGIRTNEELKNEGKLSAMSEHLSDMRKLVFDVLPINPLQDEQPTRNIS